MVVAHQLLSLDDYRLLMECIHCGLCLPVCPTYMVDGREADSPRGRLSLIKVLDRDPGISTDGVFKHIDLCLGCLACQTACPSGVRYRHLLETTRHHQRQQFQPLTWFQKTALAWFTEKSKLKAVTSLLRLLQKTHLDRLARLLPIVPRPLRFQLSGIPQITKAAFSDKPDHHLAQTSPDGNRQGTVALFTGCVMDQWYADVHSATVRVLRWNGFDVMIPKGQTCCGALHAHAGDLDTAERLLEENRTAFSHCDAQALVTNAAGCSAQLRISLWPEGNGLPVVDISEWLLPNLKHPPRYKLSQRVSYDAPCHLQHAQGIQEAPSKLLDYACEQMIPLPEADTCCGSAGLYSLVQSTMSRQVLDRKIGHIRMTAPAILATGNPGCQLQLQAGIREAGIGVSVQHTIQVLDQAYRLDATYRQAFHLIDPAS